MSEFPAQPPFPAEAPYSTTEHFPAPVRSPARAPQQSTSSKRLSRLLWVLAALCMGLVAPYLAEQIQYSITRGRLKAQSEMAAGELARLDKDAELVKLSDTSRAFRMVAKRIEPSVVHIDVEHSVESVNAMAVEEFGFQFPPGHPRGQAHGQGSGVVVDAQHGYVLTNDHVVHGAESIEVQLSDGRTIESSRVHLVGFDELTDLALLKLDADGLVQAEWGDSEQLEVGDWVLAVGNPYGLDRTVTSGIVSAKQRRGFTETRNVYQNFLQTDAAVNPGNSGGPLLNIRGELVGITTAIVGRSFQGISFSIPSMVAKEVYERLRTTGSVERGWLGVVFFELTPELAKRLGVPDRRGVAVREVFPGNPAATAGLEPGDVIVEWNGKQVEDRGELQLMVAATPVGSKVPIVVMRDGKRLELQVVVGRRPSADELRRQR
jgi:serine protease Do